MKKYNLCLMILLNSLFVINFYSAQTRLTESRFYYDAISDGMGNIYFVKWESGDYVDIWRIKSDGSNLVRITDDFSPDLKIELFPDKKNIVIRKLTEDFDHIYTMKTDGSNHKEVYRTKGYISSIKVSPDETKIAFVEDETLYVMDIDGSNVRTLAPRLLNNYSASPLVKDTVYRVSGSTLTKDKVDYYPDVITFSTDSKKIAFIGRYGEGIYTINIDGTSLTKIVDEYFYYANIQTLKSGKIMFKTYDLFFVEDHFYFDRLNVIAMISFDGSDYTIVYSTTSKIYTYAVSFDERKLTVLVEILKFEILQEEYIRIIETGEYILVVMDLTTGNVIKEVKLKDVKDIKYDSKLSFVTDNLVMLKPSGFAKDIYTINIDTLEIKNLTNNNLPTMHMLLDAAKDKILYTDSIDNKSIYIIDINGTNNRKILEASTNQKFDYLTLSPDGTKLAYVLEEPTTKYLYVKNSDGSGTPVKLAEIYVGYLGYSWSPNGYQILYSSSYFTESYFIINIDGTNKRQVAFEDINVVDCIFSPDGSQLLFSGVKDNEFKICKTDVLTLSTYTVLFSTSIYGEFYEYKYKLIDWKANKILIRLDYNLYTMNSDGSGLRYIDKGYYGSLSPDGTKIAYSGYENNSDAGFVINSDGTGKVKIADAHLYNRAKWSRDSKKLVYVDDTKYKRYLRCYIYDVESRRKDILNPYVYGVSSLFFVENDRIVYQGNFDIWIGDYSPELFNRDEIIPEQKGEIKVVVSDGAGEKGTINPDSGRPVWISYKGTSEGKYTLRIFTQFGEEIYKDSKESSMEDYFEWIPQKHLASGVYLVHIEGPGINLFEKIVILK